MIIQLVIYLQSTVTLCHVINVEKSTKIPYLQEGSDKKLLVRKQAFCTLLSSLLFNPLAYGFQLSVFNKAFQNYLLCQTGKQQKRSIFSNNVTGIWMNQT